MKKYILLIILVFSLPLYAQEEENSLELAGEAVESNPLDKTQEEGVSTAVSEETSQKAEEVKAEEVIPKEEYVAPVVAPVVTPVVTPAQTVQTSVEENEDYLPRKSRWYTTLGFEAMEYYLPFEYAGAKDSFNPEQRQLYGGRWGFGGEIYLGLGFATSTRLEGYYMGTLFESAKTAAPEENDEDVATVKDTGQIYGGDIVQTLSFMFEMRTKNPLMGDMTYLMVEPFVEAGIGRAWAFNKKDYSYDSGVVVEEYDQSFTDELTNTKFGGGINFTSKQGFFLYLKAVQNRYDITKRKTKGYFYADGDPAPTPINDSDPDKKLDAIMVYSLGGGYKF